MTETNPTPVLQSPGSHAHSPSLTPRLWTFGGKSALLTALAVVSFAASSLAANLVNDTWIDGTRTDPASPVYSENGTDGDADTNLESAWFRGGSTMDVVDDAVPGGNQLLRTAVSSGSVQWSTYFTPAGSEVDLDSDGSNFKLTWKFIPTGVGAGDTGQGLRIAFVDTPETTVTRITADGNPADGAYAGYALLMNAGTNFARSSSGRFGLYERTAAAGNILSSAGNWGTLLAQDGILGEECWTNGTEYTLTFQATRIGSDLELVLRMTGGNIGNDGELVVTNLDATPNTYKFDTLVIRPSGSNATAQQFDTTLFKVEYTAGCTVGTIYNVTGGATVCAGGTSSVGLDGSETGRDYQLLQNGSPLGSPVAGTGAALDFGLQPAGTYTVAASNTVTTCEGGMSGSAVIGQYADPVITSDPSPSVANNTFGDTRVFSVTATGPGLTYQWRKDFNNLSNGGNISGVNTPTLTLSNLVALDSGTYDCVVSNSPCGASTTSLQASLNVSAGSGLLFRTVGPGPSLWSDTSAWESSPNGTTWTTPVASAPSNFDSNIVVQAGHTIWVQSPQTADQLTVEATGALEVQNGASLTINNAAGIDANILGTLAVGTGGGSIVQGSATIQFGNGAEFNWNHTAPPEIPTATWLDGSTCRITSVNSGNNASLRASGFTGQSFYDFIYDTTTGGQVASARCRLGLAGTTEIRRDFTIKVVEATSASVTINNADNSVLTVGRNVLFQTGTGSGDANKVLPHEGIYTNFQFKIGGDFTTVGYLDGYGNAQTIFEFNGSGSQSLTLPDASFLATCSAMNWVVDNGSTLVLASSLLGSGGGFKSFANNGTLSCNGNTLSNVNTLVFGGAGVVNANGTNTIAAVVGAFEAGGTINLGSLPAFSGGESFQLVQAGAYSGSFGPIIPATPGGSFTWNTSQLNSAAILTVGSGAPTPENIVVTPIGGGQYVMTWAGAGWTVQAQTNNSLAVGLSNNWVAIPGATSPYTNTVSPGTPTTFFRLKNP